MAKLPRLLRNAVAHGAIFLVMIVALDTACYFLLPDSIALKFLDYRKSRSIVGSNLGYPPGYLIAHPQRGHDIAPGRRDIHEILEYVYPIWSNKLGCFDREWDSVPPNYVYFAGDSFTWGYTAFDEKFATLFEKVANKPSLKCGVTATGTRHQFEKFKETVAKVGHSPQRVIVSFFTNDISADFAHPSTTIVDGWLVDNAYADAAGNVVRVDQDWLRGEIAARMRERSISPVSNRSVWDIVKDYSATANVLNTARRLLRTSNEASVAPPPTRWLDFRGQKIRPVSDLDGDYLRNGRLDYRDNKVAELHREAVRAWQEHARSTGYKLSFVLIPPPHEFNNVGLFGELASFLESLGIEVMDLTQVFAEAGVGVHQAYWRYDGHFKPNGNRIVADALIRRWGK